ncbi:MAG: endonuclease/exonuclease/phosphatase family protein, partial [Candidatus Rokuibacteriota bacterium]
QPDVVCLQEIWLPRDARHLEDTWGRHGYEAIGAPEAPVRRKGGLIAFVSAAGGWKVTGSAFEEYEAEAPEYRFHEFDGLGDRGIQRIDLRHTSGAPLVVLNTHLQSQYAGRPYARIRGAQLGQLSQVAATVACDTPVLAAGDFNTAPQGDVDAPLYRRFLGDGWDDLTVEARDVHPDGTFLGATSSDGWIDYVFVRRSAMWSIRAAVVRIGNHEPGREESDHYGLSARVVFERNASVGRDILCAVAAATPSTRREILTGTVALATGRLLQRLVPLFGRR